MATAKVTSGGWTDVEAEALTLCEPFILKGAPSIERVLKASAHYLSLDTATSRLLLGPAALLRGYVSVGLTDSSVFEHGDTTTWLVEWLKTSRTSIAEPSRAQQDAILESRQNGWPVAFEPGTGDMFEVAVEYARRTTEARQTASARHVFAALLNHPIFATRLGEVVGVTPPLDIADLRRFFLAKIKISPASDERARLDEWDAIVLGRLLRLTNVNADKVAETDDGDPLGIGPYVDAFASLICRRSEVTPLSIGLFGEWGSGKSTFMSRLQRSIESFTAGEDEPDNPFFSKIVQIQFNAWHYADSNLWASLTTEFFAQLRAGGYKKTGKAIHDDLVERVTAHVSKLALEAAAASKAEKEGQAELEDAQQARNNAATAAAEARNPTPQVVLDAIIHAYETHKGDLEELGIKTNVTAPEATIDEFVKLARSLRDSGGQWRALGATVKARKWRGGLLALSLLLAVVCVVGIFWFATAAVAAFLAALAAATAAVAPGLKAINAVLRATSSFSAELKRFDDDKQKKFLESEARLEAASKEMDARREAARRADAALARYRDKAATKNPLRLLRYVLEDAPEAKAVAEQLGLISRARRLFQEVDEIARVERSKMLGMPVTDADRSEAALPDIDVPDRIVLYIDDLDRCTREQVYAVLQAVHLLLAFDIFVVVVGVDLRWVEGAIAEHFRSVDGEDDAKARGKRAVDYLEKIFQVPFWLPKLTVSSGTTESGFSKYVQGLVNIYRLIRTKMSTDERNDLLGLKGKAPLYPVAAAMAAIEVGQPIEIKEAVQLLLAPSQTLDEGKSFATAVTSARDTKSSIIPQEVEKLLTAVDTARGTRRPAKPADYRRAAELVGRFSFAHPEAVSE